MQCILRMNAAGSLHAARRVAAARVIVVFSVQDVAAAPLGVCNRVNTGFVIDWLKSKTGVDATSVQRCTNESASWQTHCYVTSIFLC
jgi:hypothetical protein